MADNPKLASPPPVKDEKKAPELVLPLDPPPTKKHCKEDKVFNDPIHGHIRLHPLLVKIIDTPQFQRLRYIKQLGGCYFVYPGASHNRFEHSIGVAHLAGKLIENIRREHANDHGINKVEIDNCDVLCVKIAGLCHDLGHGPFSHLWDKRFHKKKWEEKKWEQEEKYIMMKKEWEQKKESLEKEWEKKEVSKEDREHEEESLKNKWEQKVKKEFKWEHEEGSEKMLDYLIKENHLLGEYIDEENRLTEAHVVLIKRLINPDIDYTKKWPYPELENKSFLFEIVANKRNGVDVDKWDYFKRDCHHLGIACSFDIDRAMEFIRVIEVDGLRQICFRDKEVANMYQLFQTRLSLHRAAYQHKTSNAVECMLTEALLLADPHLMIDGHDKDGKALQLEMSKCKDNMGVFINLTDEVVQRILASPDEKLEESQALLKRIQERDLYRLIGQVTHSDLLAKTLAEDIAKFSESGALMKDDLKLDAVFFNFGKKSFNPVDYIRFYSKDKRDVAIKMEPQHVSKMLPKDDFEEAIIRVYCKCKKTEKEKAEEAKSCFEKWCDQTSDTSMAGHPLDGLNVVTRYAITPVKSDSTSQKKFSRDPTKPSSAAKNLFPPDT